MRGSADREPIPGSLAFPQTSTFSAKAAKSATSWVSWVAVIP
jgi:hypothetical protein